MTNSKLEKIRDEYAEATADNHISPYRFCDKDNATVYDITYFCAQDGFDKATEIHQQQIQKLIEALNEISMYGISEPNTQAKIAIKAINDFKTWSENE